VTQTELTKEALPEAFSDTTTAEALRGIVERDLETLTDAVPPSGYGRD
jgi:hypothetical protein